LRLAKYYLQKGVLEIEEIKTFNDANESFFKKIINKFK
jgi:hypothetical protein